MVSRRTQEEDASESRRAFLEKAGKLAVYTPPLMVALMQPSQHAVAASGGRIERGNNGLGQRIDDPQPPGLIDKPHLWNDRPSSNPGKPNNKP
jgi:hypothetical protein